MELREILGTVRRFWPLALSVIIACLAVAGTVAVLSPKRYEATTTVGIKPQPTVSVELVQFLIPSLEARVESRSLHQIVEAASTHGQGEFRISAITNPGTGVMRIVVRGTSRDAVAPLANMVARRLQHSAQESNVLSISILDEAVRPSAPMAPATLPLLLSGVILGLIAAVFAALMASSIRWRGQVRSEVRDRLGVPVLGTVPRWARRGRYASWPPARQLLHGDHQETIEACQELRANLEILLLNRGIHSMAVTGVGARDTATTITAALGWSLAAVGQSVLLVDGDLRHPLLDQALGDLSVPVGQDAEREALFRLRDAPELPLRLLPAEAMRQLANTVSMEMTLGPDSKHPVEALTLGLPRLLKVLDEPNRLIIVNTPPLDVVDSKLIAATTGSAVIAADVVRRATLTSLEQALGDFRDAGVQVLGVVLIRPVRRWRLRRARPPAGGSLGKGGTTDDPKIGSNGSGGRSGRRHQTISGRRGGHRLGGRKV